MKRSTIFALLVGTGAILVILLVVLKVDGLKPLIVRMDSGGSPRFYGISLANTNVRNGVFQVIAMLGIKAALAVPNGNPPNVTETHNALARYGILWTNLALWPGSNSRPVRSAVSSAQNIAKGIKMAEFNLENVKFTDAVRLLEEAGRRYDPDQRGISFGVLIPNDPVYTAKASALINLNLKNVTLAEAAERLCQQVDGFQLGAFGSDRMLIFEPKR